MSKKNAGEMSSFLDWLSAYRAMKEDAWEHIPSIGLYMDQVVGYLNEALAPTAKSKEEATLTASMVNNYVKFGYLSRPEKKRYTREQIAVLYLLCSMKQSLSMTDASSLLSLLTGGEDSEKLASLYTRFAEERQKTAKEVATRAEAAGNREALIESALSFVLEAEALRLVAERILISVKQEDEAQKEALAAAITLAEEQNKKAAKAAKKA